MDPIDRFFFSNWDSTSLMDADGGAGKGKAKLSSDEEAFDGRQVHAASEVHNPPGEVAAPGGLSSLAHSQPSEFVPLPDHSGGSQVDVATRESSDAIREFSEQLESLSDFLMHEDNTDQSDEPRDDGVQDDGAQDGGAEQARAEDISINHSQRRQAYSKMLKILELSKSSRQWESFRKQIQRPVIKEYTYLQTEAEKHRDLLLKIFEQLSTVKQRLEKAVNRVEQMGPNLSWPLECRQALQEFANLRNCLPKLKKDMNDVKYRAMDLPKAVSNSTYRVTKDLESVMADHKGDYIPTEALSEHVFEDTAEDRYAGLVTGKVGLSDGLGSSLSPQHHARVPTLPVQPSGAASSSSSPQPFPTPQSGAGRASDGRGSFSDPFAFSPPGIGRLSDGAGSSYSQPSPTFLPENNWRLDGAGSSRNFQAFPPSPSGNFTASAGAGSSYSEPYPTISREAVGSLGAASSSWSPQFVPNSPVGTASHLGGGGSSSNPQLRNMHLDGADNDLYSQLRSRLTENFGSSNRADGSPNPGPHGSNSSK